MTNRYRQHTSRGLTTLWLLGAALSVWAQSVQPPIQQWQRTVEGRDLAAATRVQAVSGAKTGYGVLAGKQLVRLSATGDVIWTNQLSGTYQDSLSGYVAARQTLAIAATPDDGFAVLTLDVLNLYSVTKVDSAGSVVWTRLVDHASAGTGIRVSDNALTAAPDGSLLVVGTFSDGLSYTSLTKLNREGAVSGQWRINTAGTSRLTKALSTSDGGYLLVGAKLGSGASMGVAIKVDRHYTPTWQNTYPAVDSLLDVVSNPSSENTYTAIGVQAGGNSQLLTISPGGQGDGNAVALFSGSYGMVSLANDGAGNLTVLDGTGPATSDFRLKNVNAQATVRWTKSFGGSGNDVPTGLLATRDGGYLAVGTTTSTDGDVVGRSTGTTAAWVVKLGNSSVATTLRLQAPAYNCQTGAIVFRTAGGDGTPIFYNAPGITRASLMADFGTVEPGLRNDPKVITIQATQSGQTVSYAFDLDAYCSTLQSSVNSPAPGALALVVPTYNCQTGALTFHSTGGDGTPVEYAAPGVTGWTTNPNQFVDAELRTAYDAQPLTLMARQSGQVVMYVLNLKAVCGRARLAIAESAPVLTLTVSVLGNPVRETVTVEVRGAQDQLLQLRLVDGYGRVVEQRSIEQAAAAERQTFDFRQQAPGALLLHTTANGQSQTLKVVKQ